jgi:hypothetical protein
MLGSDPTQPGGVPAATEMPAKKRSLKWLWITLGVVAALILVGGGAGIYALAQFSAPAAAATQFCGDLKAQNYDSAYAVLSAKLKASYSSDQFRLASTTLDAAEGKVTACGAASGANAYNYSLGSNHATVTASITRATQGPLQGGVHLVSEGGAWKVDAMDTTLLGINLGALQTLAAFCEAEQSQSYDTAYGLLSTGLQSLAPQTQFSILQTLQDAVDGKVTACAIKAIPAGNDDTNTTVTVTVTRSTLGAASGTVKLEATGGAWKISQIDQSVQGTNLQPLLVGTEFCLFVGGDDFPDAYKLLASGVQQSNTVAQVQAAFALPAGDKWTPVCSPDMTTYQVTASTAQYSGTFLFTNASNAVGQAKINFAFIVENGSWKIEHVDWSA